MVRQVQQQTTRDNETGEFIARRGGQAGRRDQSTGLHQGPRGQCFGVPGLGRIGQFKPKEWAFGKLPWGSYLRGKVKALGGRGDC